MTPQEEEYTRQALAFLPTASYKSALNVYQTIVTDPAITPAVLAEMGRRDRYFLLTQLLNRAHLYHPWSYERCREVEAAPDGHLDLWAREHGKSSCITFGGSIQEILCDPEITIGIFSHTGSIAADFLKQIKREFEANELLKSLYSDILWSNPKRESPQWSTDSGIIVKRKGNPRESTVEGWGLVDGQPTGKHFRLMIYDDVVTRESVTSPEMIAKTTEAWELSRSLSAMEDGDKPRRVWYIGTRYNFADTYRVMLTRQVATPRIYPATDNGLPDGKPVLLSQSDWDTKKKETPGNTLACQQLLDPRAGNEQEFKESWLRRYVDRPTTLNVAILVDPANSKKKSSCNTAMAVIGIDTARNKYLIDGACHKMSLTERWQMLKYLRNKWVNSPGIQVVKVGYEKYGMQADIEHFNEMMKIENAAFPIDEVSWTKDGEQAKDDRIRRLIPDFQNWRFFLPEKPIKRKNDEGRLYDVVEWFTQNEYLFFPATTMKDFLDAMSRIYDLDIEPPMIVADEDTLPPYDGDW